MLAMVCFRVLGPVEVYRGERRVELAGPRQVALLAFLVVHANRAVSTDRLIDALWGDREAVGAVKRVQVGFGDAAVDTLSFDVTGHSLEDMGWQYHSYTPTATSAREPKVSPVEAPPP